MMPQLPKPRFMILGDRLMGIHMTEEPNHLLYIHWHFEDLSNKLSANFNGTKWIFEDGEVRINE